jgi:CelD/BcsL family acetyltransferase involved in cellulose biosynthesis
MLTCAIIDNAAEFAAFEPSWRSFLERTPSPAPFQRPAWLIPWWLHFGSGELRVVVASHNDTVAGIIPLFLHEWNGRRQLTLLGSGISDYTDPVLDLRHALNISKCLGECLEHWRDWDICVWQDLSAGTPLSSLGKTEPDTPCSQIRFDGSFDDFLAARPKDLRRNLRRYKEQAQAIAPVTFEVKDYADRESTEALIRLHRARWNALGESGMIEANSSEGFLRDVVITLASGGLLIFFAVRFNGSIAAILLALRDGDTIYSWLSAFDPAHERFGFGRELLAQSLRYAHDHGYKAWNFLRGEEPYKFSWGAQPIPKCRVVIER